MGRKSQSKHNSKKTLGKDSNKLELQKRKDLAVLVDKLLKLTSIFQATGTPAKSWEYHLEVDSLLKQIYNIELPRRKNEERPRQTNLDEFTKWLDDNGAQYEGVEISSFEGYDLGLKATTDFKEGSLLLTVPRKLMMSEKDARDSELGCFIEIDPLLQNMPNITLALFLLLEKNKSDSFWKPYIDILPEKYSTILYFTSDELAELKPSPVIESSLKLYRSIARQYAYFYNKIHTLDLPVLKRLQDIFTFDNYRWAVSAVMTRQNNIKLSDVDTTAFIPLWDMCNHEHGKITTDFNKDLNRGECFAVRDFKAGEQIFIFYGARPNSDLFLHNGNGRDRTHRLIPSLLAITTVRLKNTDDLYCYFIEIILSIVAKNQLFRFVYPNNQHDSLSLSLGISSSDPLREQRLQLLLRLGLACVTHYNLHRGPLPPGAELLAFIRIFTMNQEELTKWSSLGVPSDLVSSEPASAAAVGAAADRRAYLYLRTRCRLLRAAYTPAEAAPAEGHRRNIQLLKECEVQTLDGAIKYLDTILDSLPDTGDTK